MKTVTPLQALVIMNTMPAIYWTQALNAYILATTPWRMALVNMVPR